MQQIPPALRWQRLELEAEQTGAEVRLSTMKPSGCIICHLGHRLKAVHMNV